MKPTSTQTFHDYGRQFAKIYDSIFPREALNEAEITWLKELIPADALTIYELGVGTGRVAIPLQKALIARGQEARFVGVDISQEMLDQLTAADPEGSIEPVKADISAVEYEEATDVVLCVCATISMLRDPDLQTETIRLAAEVLKPGGILVIETHHVDAVKALHVHDSVTYCIPYPGHQRALVSFSTLSGIDWHVDHAWLDGGTATFACEDSRLTSLDELDAYAAAAGLEAVAHHQGFTAEPVTAGSPSATAIYRKPF